MAYKIQIVKDNDENDVINTIRIPKHASDADCTHLKISMTSMMVISAVVPFVIVTCMHIAYALSCTSQYTMPVAVGMIMLNILCILPYISWFAFVGLFVWLVFGFIRRSTHSPCRERMQVLPLDFPWHLQALREAARVTEALRSFPPAQPQSTCCQ